MVLDHGNMAAQSVMGKIYRIIAIGLILLGMLLAAWAVEAAFNSVTRSYSPHPIHCTATGCSSVLSDGSLADDNVARPKGPRR